MAFSRETSLPITTILAISSQHINSKDSTEEDNNNAFRGDGASDGDGTDLDNRLRMARLKMADDRDDKDKDGKSTV